jgi:arylsulfatase A-like enzyme
MFRCTGSDGLQRFAKTSDRIHIQFAFRPSIDYNPIRFIKIVTIVAHEAGVARRTEKNRTMRNRILAAVVFTTGLFGHALPTHARQPNVVVIIADDLGYSDLGFQGGRDIPTPRLDALAASGVRCTSGYVTGPYCSPTRAALFTGKYQQRFGHEFNPGGNAEESGLPVSQVTIADRLKKAGYATGLVGKWHLGSKPKYHPQQRGFDEFFGFLGGAHTYFAEQTETILKGTEVIHEKEYLTDAIARESVAFIERHKAAPFFLAVTFNAVHTPMDATDARLAKFTQIADPERRKYAAMLVAMDEAVGRVIDALKAADLEKETLIVFFSDNGGPTMPGTTINASINAPLRGSKRTTLEGGVRVPFVLSWKGTLPEGKTYDKPVIQIDVAPTALAAAGVSLPTDGSLEGVDLLPYLTGKKEDAPHESLFWRLGGQKAVRKGDWKLVRYDAAVDTPGEVSRGASPNLSPVRLYDLSTDIGEKNDLAADHPEKVKELTAAWDSWNASNIAPAWGPAAGAGAAATKKAAAKKKR